MSVRKLNVENISLQKQVASLNEAMKARKWVDFKQNALTPLSSKTMLFGDLLISNIDENKLFNCHVECYPNKGVDTVNQTLSKYQIGQVMGKVVLKVQKLVRWWKSLVL